MSQATTPDQDGDVWEDLAELDDLLEQIVEDDMPLNEEAKILLEELEARGYR